MCINGSDAEEHNSESLKTKLGRGHFCARFALWAFRRLFERDKSGVDLRAGRRGWEMQFYRLKVLMKVLVKSVAVASGGYC
jgi:hypothetical protein